MAQIIVTADGPGETAATEVHRERIVPADFETDHAGSLLIERIGWALSDADELEGREAGRGPQTPETAVD